MLGHHDRLVPASRQAIGRLLQAQLVDQLGEAFAILGQVDAVGGCAEDRIAGRLDFLGQLERRLAAQLDDHALQLPLLRLTAEDFEHILAGQRLEVEPVRRVGVGRHRLRVAVDHDRLETRILQREGGVAAAIVELDPLPDPVRPAAEDDDLALVADLRLVLRLAEQRRLIGRVEIGRGRIELGRAAVDPLEHRADAELRAAPAAPRPRSRRR